VHNPGQCPPNIAAAWWSLRQATPSREELIDTSVEEESARTTHANHAAGSQSAAPAATRRDSDVREMKPTQWKKIGSGEHLRGTLRPRSPWGECQRRGEPGGTFPGDLDPASILVRGCAPPRFGGRQLPMDAGAGERGNHSSPPPTTTLPPPPVPPDPAPGRPQGAHGRHPSASAPSLSTTSKDITATGPRPPPFGMVTGPPAAAGRDGGSGRLGCRPRSSGRTRAKGTIGDCTRESLVRMQLQRG